MDPFQSQTGDELELYIIFFVLLRLFICYFQLNAVHKVVYIAKQ